MPEIYKIPEKKRGLTTFNSELILSYVMKVSTKYDKKRILSSVLWFWE